VLAHLKAESDRDVAATLATFSDANYDVVPLGAPAKGATAVDEPLHELFDAFSDFNAEMLSLHHGEDIVFVEMILTGTHRGNWAGVAPTHRPIRVRCGSVFQFEGDGL
jgi:steroid delta-isomerase-like uncharacterized protein